ncbi:MAG: ribonuclease H-like domain-containing protein [Candidatus Eisenbacteria bacterium]
MSPSDALKSRLGELVRKRRAGTLMPAGRTGMKDEEVLAQPTRRRRRMTEPEPAVMLGVEAYLPGGEWRDAKGTAVYIHERLRSDVEKRKPHWGRLPEPPPGEPELSAVRSEGLERALFLDLETCGLSSSPVFLAGTMFWNGEDFVIRQYFARHYGEEVALLHALAEQARAFDLLVTFNGKSYDAPFLHSRAMTHRVPLQLPSRHLDLLHASRRRWKGRLPDCRLTTIERHVTRRRRVGDVSGAEVPDLYHAFVRDGDPYPLVPVFHHNLLDVITMAEILNALCQPEKPRSMVWE